MDHAINLRQVQISIRRHVSFFFIIIASSHVFKTNSMQLDYKVKLVSNLAGDYPGRP